MASLNSMMKDFVKKQDLDSLLSRIEKVEKENKEQDSKIDKQRKKHQKWKPKWIQMQKDIEELKKQIKNTVDQSTFDDELDRIKSLINQLASSGTEIKVPLIPHGPSISSKDLSDLREAIKKVAEHEDRLNNLNLDQILRKIGQLAEEVTKKADQTTVAADLKKTNESLKSLNDWCKKLEDMFSKLQQ